MKIDISGAALVAMLLTGTASADPASLTIADIKVRESEPEPTVYYQQQSGDGRECGDRKRIAKKHIAGRLQSAVYIGSHKKCRLVGYRMGGADLWFEFDDVAMRDPQGWLDFQAALGPKVTCVASNASARSERVDSNTAYSRGFCPD